MFGQKKKRKNPQLKFDWKNNNTAPRLNWKQMEKIMPAEKQEGCKMVKGLSRRVIVIKSPDERYFDEAIFILKDEIFGQGDQAAILRQARKVADSFVKPPEKPQKTKKSSSKFPKHLFAVAYSLGTAAAAILTCLPNM